MADQKLSVRVCTILTSVLVVITLIPIALLVLSSFTDEQEILSSGYTLFPKKMEP